VSVPTSDPEKPPPSYWFASTWVPPDPTERRGHWHLLLLAPVALSLLTPLYNRLEPRLAGIPFFYWGQLACVVIGIAVTVFVYRVTKAGR